MPTQPNGKKSVLQRYSSAPVDGGRARRWAAAEAPCGVVAAVQRRLGGGAAPSDLRPRFFLQICDCICTRYHHWGPPIHQHLGSLLGRSIRAPRIAMQAVVRSARRPGLSQARPLHEGVVNRATAQSQHGGGDGVDSQSVAQAPGIDLPFTPFHGVSPIAVNACPSMFFSTSV